jgi:hypothetical protein
MRKMHVGQGWTALDWVGFEGVQVGFEPMGFVAKFSRRGLNGPDGRSGQWVRDP